MFQSRKVKLKPTKEQVEFFHKNFGAARFVYNWGLEQLNKHWEENKDKEKNHGEWGTGDQANGHGDSSSTKRRYSLSRVANRGNDNPKESQLNPSTYND